MAQSGYRNMTDVYGRVSYFLTHKQIELIKREASIRGEELSAFVRTIVQYYYDRNPLTPDRIKELLEQRLQKETRCQHDWGKLMPKVHTDDNVKRELIERRCKICGKLQWFCGDEPIDLRDFLSNEEDREAE